MRAYTSSVPEKKLLITPYLVYVYPQISHDKISPDLLFLEGLAGQLFRGIRRPI